MFVSIFQVFFFFFFKAYIDLDGELAFAEDETYCAFCEDELFLQMLAFLFSNYR